MSTHPNLADKQ